MLDLLFASIGQTQKLKFDQKYSTDQAITRVEYIPGSSEKLAVIFPPWHMPRIFIAHLIKELQQNGDGILLYTFNPSILNNNVQSIKNSFEYIALVIAEDVRELQANHNIQTVNLLGISLGNVALCITAEKLDGFDTVTMVVPGKELAQPLWEGWRTRQLRKVLETQHYTLKDLEAEWIDMAPESHIETLKTHQVHIVLAKHDHFIPYESGAEFVKRLFAVDPKVTTTTSPYGHIATILSYFA